VITRYFHACPWENALEPPLVLELVNSTASYPVYNLRAQAVRYLCVEENRSNDDWRKDFEAGVGQKGLMPELTFSEIAVHLVAAAGSDPVPEALKSGRVMPTICLRR